MAKCDSKRDPYLDKMDFLDQLISMDKDQINLFIKQNGKQPKLICPIVVTDVKRAETMEE